MASFYFDENQDQPSIYDFPTALKPEEKDLYKGSEKKDKALDLLKAFSSVLDSVDRNKNRRIAEESGPKFKSLGGLDTRGFGTQEAFPGFAISHTPPAFSPFVMEGYGGGKSAGQRMAGAASGAFQGFLSGAATGMPHMAGLGAIVGGVGGAFG